jgi:hypothetical protein
LTLQLAVSTAKSNACWPTRPVVLGLFAVVEVVVGLARPSQQVKVVDAEGHPAACAETNLKVGQLMAN